METWFRQHEPKWLTLSVAFPSSLCIRYVNVQMKREKNGALLGPGNLNANIQMLKFKGFTSHGHAVPPDLALFFKDAHESHKRNIMTLVDNGKQQLCNSHAQNSSWAAIEYCAELLPLSLILL